ncbi:hypothetical protein K466DRAFT_551818 [Polyporus arcularius HHB13444]|uniref:BTB domain-containing protein n=1 Tax=Polyporus arcularius HHB13444 TaxID=1314778 RepID=A0A5C3P7E3_9APHY|nr:hypothetical protein K466DRAFT_551818 [Polyporus arcularius HHB13444]
MSARTTRKRARPDSQDWEAAETQEAGGEQAGMAGAGRKRDEEFWFEDGNVMLVARDVEFRVFKGILADHSPVFKDMFSLPQPPEYATALCPVVHVTDAPEDLRHLLRVYMPKTEPSPFLPEDPSFDVISATVRLGHKYQIAKLVEHSIDYLKKYYTTDYAAFAQRGHPYWPPSFKAEHAIGVINLAHLTGELSLLPLALFICCTLDKDIVKGVQRGDGSWEQLTLDDIGLCFAARGRLVARRAEATTFVFDLVRISEGCTKPGRRCAEVLRDVLTKLKTSEWAVPDPFSSVLRGYSQHLKTNLCSACWRLARTLDEEEFREMWTQLPTFFGLEAQGDDDSDHDED